jgi:hypothetical protein
MSITIWIMILAGFSAIILAVGFVEHKWWAVVLALICLAIVVILQRQDEYEKYGNDQKWVGSVIPDASSSLPRPNDCPTPDNEVRLFLGNTLIATKTETTALNMTNGSFIMIRLRAMPSASIFLSISLRLLDEHGHTLVTIDDNVFRINSHVASRMLISKNKDHLRVYDFANREL